MNILLGYGNRTVKLRKHRTGILIHAAPIIRGTNGKRIRIYGITRYFVKKIR
jgi:hypothetical protein